MGLHRLRPEPVLADVREQHLARHLALAEARDADGAGEVRRRVLDGVLELVRRDVDREADAVPAELLDLRHSVIQAEGFWTTGGEGVSPASDFGQTPALRLEAPLG